MTVTRFVVSPAALGGLAGLVPGGKSPLSPLHIPNPPELTPGQHEELFEAGILDQNGLVKPAQRMLAALSEAPSFSRVRLNAPAGYLDEAIYFTGEGKQTVGISNTPDGLVFTAPGDAESIFSQMKDYTGSSAHEVPAWSVELYPLEMLCLAALMDLRRKAVLRAIVDQQPVVPLPCDIPSITSAIQSMWGNPQWLTNALENASAMRTPPAAPLVEAALSSLVEEKFAWHQSGNYYPIPEAIQTADRFLLIGTVVNLDSGSANMQGRYVLSRQSWLQSTIAEMLNICLVKDKLRLQLVSPAAALEKIQFFLTNYDALPAPPIESVELSLEMQAEMGTGQTLPLAEETVLGRSEQATVHILDSRASRRHAVIRKLTQGYQLTDAGSTNGTFINGELVSGPCWLHEGDVISIGETQIKVIRTGRKAGGLTGDQNIPVASILGVHGQPETGGMVRSAQMPDPSQPIPTTPLPDEGASTEEEVEITAPELPQEPTMIALEEPVESGEALSEAIKEGIPPGEQLDADVKLPDEAQPAVLPASIEPVALSEGFADAPPQPPEPLVCPQCGSVVSPGARFCGACGFRVVE